MPEILVPSADVLRAAVTRLRDGGVVAFPTETVYGLGAATFDAAALERVFAMKGRPADNPLIAHVTGVDGPAGARRVVGVWTDAAQTLADRFWPGPLTLVLPRADDVPPRATADLPTIAVRAPRHPVAQDLLAALGAPISAPSANRSGHVSPTSARHVADDFADADLLVLDGGDSVVGLESTVLDLTTDPPRVLRPGSVTEGDLRDVLGPIAGEPVASQAASPGTSARHYAPRTPVELVASSALSVRLADTRTTCVVLCFDAADVPPPHRPLPMPQGAGAYARCLYAMLRRADAMGGVRIVIERPPPSNELWKAIGDRLRRASAP